MIRKLTIYVTNPNGNMSPEILITNSKGILLHQTALTSKEKSAKYVEGRLQISPDGTNLKGRECQESISIGRVINMSVKNYRKIICMRQQELKEYWRQYTSQMNSYSRQINEHGNFSENAQNEREERIKAIPEPESLVNLVLKLSRTV